MRYGRIIILALALLAGVVARGQCDSLQLPLREGFDSYGTGSEVLPPCWVSLRNYDVGYPPHLDALRHYSGTASLVLYPGTLAESHYSMVIGPPLEGAGPLAGLYLRFRYLSTSTAARLVVGFCEDTGRYTRAFVPLDTVSAGQSLRWHEAIIDLASYAGSGRRIAFCMQRSLQADNAGMYIDDLNIEACGTSAPWASHVGSDRLTLHFEAYGQGVVEVVYGQQTVSPAASPLVVEGLQPETDYTFSVGCVDGLHQQLTVSTLESAGLVPAYYENFDALQGQLPDRWRAPAVRQPSVAAGQLRMAGDSCMAVMPLPVCADTHAAPHASRLAELMLALEVGGSASLVVGALEFAGQPEGFEPIDTVLPAAGTQLVPLASYGGTSRYPALMAAGGGTLTLDQVRLAHCMLSGARLYNITDDGLTAEWDTLYLADSAEVQFACVAAGTVPTGGIRLVAGSHGGAQPYTFDGTHLTLGGLLADTEYDLYLWPTCGDLPAACDRLRFRTFAHEVLPPYCVGFDDDVSLPQGWVPAGNVSVGTNAYRGQRSLSLAAGSAATLPLLGAAAPATVWLDFYATGAGTLVVGLRDNPYSPVDTVATLTASAGWQRYTVALPSAAGRCVCLAASGAWTVDALALRDASVASASVGAVGQQSARLTLVLTGTDSASVEYAAVASADADFEPGSGTTLSMADTLTLSGLQPGTDYALHVSPLDGTIQCNHLTVRFATLEGPVALPYCQNFNTEAVGRLPQGWRRLSAYGDYPIVSTLRNRSGGRSLLMAAAAGRPTVAVLPDAVGCSPKRSLDFWVNAVAGASRLVVGHMADITDLESFVPADTIVPARADAWQAVHVTVDSVRGHLALLLATDDAEARLCLEDLCLENCAAYGIRAYDVDSTGVTIAWQATDSLALLCQVTGSRVDTLHRSPSRVEGLVPGQSYYITLGAVCPCGSEGAVYWSGHGSSAAATHAVSFTVNVQPTPVGTPYCNDFEATAAGYTPYYWRGATTTDRNHHLGNHAASASGRVVLPPVDNPQGLALSLWLYGSSEPLLSDSAVVVGVMQNPDSAHTFVPVDTLRLAALGRWQHLVADLAAYAGSGRYITLYPCSGSGTFYIDDVSLSACALDSVYASSSGLVGWLPVHGVERVAVEYGVAGFARGSGTADTVSAALRRFQVPSVMPATNYDVYLVPLCGGASSCQQVSIGFGSGLAMPYCEWFDEAPSAGMPSGWTVSRTHDGTPALAASAGGQALQFKASATSRSMAALPEVALPRDGLCQLSLSLRTPNHNRARLVVGQAADPSDPNTFIPRDTIVPTASNTWQTFRLRLDGYTQGTPLALACMAATQTAELLVDSIGLAEGLTPEVAVLSARRLELVSQDSDYYMEYGPAGTPQGQGTTLHITSSPYRVAGLVPGQTYWLHFRHADSVYTCLAPTVAAMPTEETLPYCRQRDTLSTLVLPELAVDSVDSLRLHLGIRSGGRVEVGVIERRGDWNSFVVVDTVEGGAWREVSLDAYRGEGRFVALRALDGTAIVDNFMATTCSLPAVGLGSDNRLGVAGVGVVEYGPAGFLPGSGTVVAAPDTVQLPNSATYDLYRLCSAGSYNCLPPLRIATAVDRCPLPDSLDVSQTGDGHVVLSWPVRYSGFYLEYSLAGEQDDGTVVRLDTPPVTLVLQPDTAYELRLRCDSVGRTLRPPQRVRTLAAPVELPWCAGFGTDLAGWRVIKDRAANYARVEDGRLTVSNYYGTTYVVMPQPLADSLRGLAVSFYARFHQSAGHTLTLGTMIDATDPLTFDSVAAFTSMRGSYKRCFHMLDNYYGAGRFLALRVSDDDVVDIDDLQVGGCAAHDFRMTAMEADHVVIEWRQTGAAEVHVLYGPRDSSWSSYATLVHTDTLGIGPRSLRIGGLTPLTNYAFRVWGECGGGCDSLFKPHAALADTFYTFTPQGGEGCIDYTDLNASYTTCSYGSYQNPTEHQGAVDYGYLNAASRHTVHTDTAERDARTGGLLRTIAEGEQASVRLGNWNSGGNASPQSESITYGLVVDAAAADLLVLRYAAVLQDPEHAPSLQPRFRLEILNQQGSLIDSCSMADFIANAALGWAQAAGGVLWKDWTTVGIDLAPYDGQTIFIRLTTHDCGEGSHFGYAYFTLRCASKRMQSEGCSVVPDNRFTVPSGFNYRWYSSADTTATLSDSASLWVRSDNTITYYCRLSFVDNPQCHFTMSAFAGARYPLALFDTAVTAADCRLTLRLQNRSTVSGDGLTPLGTGEPVETLRWLLPDGSSTAPVATLTLPDTGTVSVALVAGIAQDQCLDTLRRTISVGWPHAEAWLEGAAERCSNAAPDTVRVHAATTYSWEQGPVQQPFVAAPTADTVLRCYTTDGNGCRDTLVHAIAVHRLFGMHHRDSVCSSAGSYRWLDTVLAFAPVGAFDSVAAALLRRDRYGCDSLHTLALTLAPAYYPQLSDTICDGVALPFFDTLLTTTGTYRHDGRTTLGCDSVSTLTLSVMPVYAVLDSREVCDSLRWGGRLFTTDSLGALDSLHSIYGCDSVAMLSLIVHRSASSLLVDTMCAGSGYSWRGHTFGHAADSLEAPCSYLLTDTLGTIHGCDSLLSLALTELPLPRLAVDTLWHCGRRAYTLVAHADVPYLRWSAWPDDGVAFGADSVIDVAPAVATTYTLYADYHADPLCPATTAVALQPLVPPAAQLRVTPSMLTVDDLRFTARDVAACDYGLREWYVDSVLQTGTGRLLEGVADPRRDSARVWLVVADDHCADTAVALIPIQHETLFVPNIFTPGAETNNRFGAVGSGVATYELSVYNRRGLLVFHTNSIDDQWDGTDQGGNACPSGAYVYRLRFSDRLRPTVVHTSTGTVLLVR